MDNATLLSKLEKCNIKQVYVSVDHITFKSILQSGAFDDASFSWYQFKDKYLVPLILLP